MKDYKRLTDRDITKETKQKLCIVLCDIRRRCLNPNYKYFYLYGERGISVCEEWLGKDGQKNFREWAVNNGYEKGLTIDRIDNNKGYSPDNCRWVTSKEQSYNRRSNKLITIHGKTQTVTEWAKETGMPIGTLQNRLRYGWEEDRLLEPKQVHLKMSKHEMRVEILKLRKQLKEYQSKIEDGTLVELPCKCIEELDIIKDGMIFIFYKMCLEQNLGQGIFLEYKSKINEWFKSYLKTKDCRKKGNERVQEINKQ